VQEGVARSTALASIAAAAIFFVIAVGLAADNYPTRPIILVISLPPGGTNDIMARAVADKMSAALGQRIVIENRNAGGSGTVGTREVARAAPDGYTIILGYTSTLATGPHIFSNVGYDPRKDFAPLGLIASAPALLLVHRDLPVHTVGELIALMKASREPYQVATPGAGTVNYLASILFAQQAGVRVRQSWIQSDSGVAGGARGRLCPRFGRDVEQTFDLDARVADARGVRVARIRCHADLWIAGTRAHASPDRRAAEPGTARRPRQR
jgi:tripartite-type tricarboxylate transporter receptor subunit TctC